MIIQCKCIFFRKARYSQRHDVAGLAEEDVLASSGRMEHTNYVT